MPVRASVPTEPTKAECIHRARSSTTELGFIDVVLGRRIALMFATRGGTAPIYARRAEQLASATQYVTETLPKELEDRGSGEVGVATAAESLAEALDGTWLAVESVPEKLEIKVPPWGQIDEAAPPDTIFATNSSSYPSRLMAEKVRDKNGLCNMHFYMPPEFNAVDLMSDGETDEDVPSSVELRSLSSANLSEADLHCPR
jgi:3-hydroxybutyryl-CoA dehydrogenase